jgi:hypothetical protein
MRKQDLRAQQDDTECTLRRLLIQNQSPTRTIDSNVCTDSIVARFCSPAAVQGRLQQNRTKQ